MKATMEVFTADGMDTLECEVVFRNNQMIVSYADDDGPTIYEGPNTDFGYVLDCPRKRGRGTLHSTSGNKLQFEGSWVEAGFRGMWIIDIDDV